MTLCFRATGQGDILSNARFLAVAKNVRHRFERLCDFVLLQGCAFRIPVRNRDEYDSRIVVQEPNGRNFGWTVGYQNFASSRTYLPLRSSKSVSSTLNTPNIPSDSLQEYMMLEILFYSLPNKFFLTPSSMTGVCSISRLNIGSEGGGSCDEGSTTSVTMLPGNGFDSLMKSAN